MKKNNAQKGISLLETLIVIAILSLFSAFSYSAFVSLNQNRILEKETSSGLSLLEEARMYTLASKAGTQYGVHFESTKTVLFAGASYNAGDSSNVTILLNPLVQINPISLTGAGAEIIFDRLTGKTAEDGTVTFSLRASPSSGKTIAVGKTGLAEIH